MNYKKIILLSLMLGFGICVSQAQKTMSLQQAIETGIKNNIDVLQSGLLTDKSEILWKQSRMQMLPNLNGNINQGINYGKSIDPFTNTFINQNVSFGSYGASSNLLLFNGLSLQNQIKANKLGYEASQMELQQAKDNLTINIILAYLQVLSSKDILKQAQEQVNVTINQVNRLALLNDTGAISPSNYYDVKGQLASEQVTISNSKANLETAKLNLTQLLNIPYDKNLEAEPLPDELIDANSMTGPDEIYQTALKQFAQVKAAELRTQSAEKNVRSIRGSLYPTLSFGANINTNYSSVAAANQFIGSTIKPSSDYVDINGTHYPVYQQSNNYTVQKLNFNKQLNDNLFYTLNIGLTIPLFNASRVRSQVKVAKIDMESSRLREENTKVLLQQAIERAYVNLVSSADKYKLLLDQVNSFEESFRIAEVKFNSGVITSVDYLVAKNNLDQSKSNLIISKYDFILREKILNFYAGKVI